MEKPPGEQKSRSRFYADVACIRRGKLYALHLDGKPVRTPAGSPFAVPSEALGEAVAEEWRGQGERIRPETMPLTKLANTAIDGVQGSEEAVIDDIVSYAGADLLCYRAADPELIDRQKLCWDPMLGWARRELGAEFATTDGVVHRAQPDAVLALVRDALTGLDPVRLTAAHVITTLTGSAVLALALLQRAAPADKVWEAAHVDEDWQVSRWGADHEAAHRRKMRKVDFDAAVRMLEMVDG